MKPLVGLSCDCVKTKCDAVDYKVRRKYTDALLRHADVSVVIIPNIDCDDNVENIVSRLDGIVFCGGATNVNPKLYGGDYVLKEGEEDFARDRTSMCILKNMKKRGMPFFGICRGMQELNVFCGGTLKGDIHKGSNNFTHLLWQDGALNYERRQELSIDKDSILHPINEGNSKAIINSIHTQSIDKLGDGLKVGATCPQDGIVEAIYMDNHPSFCLGVQWHPEYKTSVDSTLSVNIFKQFGKSCQDYKNRVQ